MTIQYDNVEAALVRVTGEPKHGRFRCPSHNGEDYNLAIRDGDRKLQLICFSHHCDGVDILASLDMTLKDIYYNNKLSRKTPNWILPPERLERCKSIVTLHASILERNPNHEFEEQDIWLLGKAKTELHHHFSTKFGGEL